MEGEGKAVASRAADPSDGRGRTDGRWGSTVGRTDGLALSIGSEGAERAGDLEVCSKDGLRRYPSKLSLLLMDSARERARAWPLADFC